MLKLLILCCFLAATPSHALDSTSLFCMANTVYHEARGEILAGQYAVAYVILNRIKHQDFPNTVCDVVSQKHQFTGYKPKAKLTDIGAWQQALNVAKNATVAYKKGYDTTKGALYFNSTKRKGIRIGNHVFYQ